jgi:hypothetical protein
MRSAPFDSITITPQTPGWEDSDLWRERMYVMSNSTLAKIFSKVNPNALNRYFMEDYEETMRYQHILPVVESDTRFTCEREMIRDYDKELDHCDGFSYWRTTGRLIVTWYNGSKTIIANKDVAIDAKVIDCGYDDVLPF